MFASGVLEASASGTMQGVSLGPEGCASGSGRYVYTCRNRPTPWTEIPLDTHLTGVTCSNCLPVLP